MFDDEERRLNELQERDWPLYETCGTPMLLAKRVSSFVLRLRFFISGVKLPFF